MHSLLPFAILACALAGLASHLTDSLAARRPGPAAARETPLVAPAVAGRCGGPRSIIIAPDFNGNFNVEAAVDGRRLRFLVDTGASVVTLNSDDAARVACARPRATTLPRAARRTASSAGRRCGSTRSKSATS